jgi:hypothetical protein
MVLGWRADDTTSDYFDCKDFSPRTPRCHRPTQFVVGAQLAVGRELWLMVPLTVEGAEALLSSVGSHDVESKFGSRSNTPLAVRRAAHAQL